MNQERSMDLEKGFEIEELNSVSNHVWKAEIELILSYGEVDGVLEQDNPFSLPKDLVEHKMSEQRDREAVATEGLS